MSFSDALRYLRANSCPFNMIRLGGESDGAYLLPDDLDGVAACFSPGVGNKKDFEDELCRLYGIRTHMCDFRSDLTMLKTSLIPGFQTFRKKWCDTASSSTSISLKDWIEIEEPDETQDLILQMDIEGAEYRNLFRLPDECLSRFRIVVLELHSLNRFDGRLFSRLKLMLGSPLVGIWEKTRHELPAFLRHGKVGKVIHKLGNFFEPNLLKAMLEKIHRTHLCVHVHPNNCRADFIHRPSGQNVPRALEVTFLRRDRFALSSNPFVPPQIPHPLDIQNVREMPGIILNEHWIAPT